MIGISKFRIKIENILINKNEINLHKPVGLIRVREVERMVFGIKKAFFICLFDKIKIYS